MVHVIKQCGLSGKYGTLLPLGTNNAAIMMHLLSGKVLCHMKSLVAKQLTSILHVPHLDM